MDRVIQPSKQLRPECKAAMQINPFSGSCLLNQLLRNDNSIQHLYVLFRKTRAGYLRHHSIKLPLFKPVRTLLKFIPHLNNVGDMTAELL